MVEFLKTWGTLSLAVIALIQPWLLALYKRVFRQAQIDFYETGNIEVGFSNFGPTIGLHGTLRSVHRDSFVKGIALKLTRCKDNAEHTFSWGLFRSEKLSVATGRDTTLQICTGFMLTPNSPLPCNVQYWDRDVQEELRPHLEALRTAWTEAFMKAGGSQLLESGADLAAIGSELQAATSNLYGEFFKTSEHVNAYNGLNRLCYWEPGKYRLQMIVQSYRPDRIHTRLWHFELTRTDAEALRLNTLKILQEACGQYFGVYHFAFPKYLLDVPSC